MTRLCLCALGILSGLMPSSVRADLPFLLGQEFDAGVAPWGCVVGDIDGAGGVDIAVANAAIAGEASVLLGNGEGNFVRAAPIPVDKEPRGIAAGDFNSDQILDLVISSVSDDPADIVSVALGIGDGTFEQPSEYEVGRYPNAVKVADLNDDDSPDIVLISTGGEVVSVLMGGGDGTFSARVDYSLPNFLPWDIAIKDMDGDEIDDAVVSAFSTSATFAILRGIGDGSFFPPQYVGTNGSHSSLTLEDFNEDGRLDVALLNAAVRKVYVFFANSAGDFDSDDFVSFPVAPGTESIEAGDLYGNGRIQIVAAGFDGVHVFQALDSGTFMDMGAISGAFGGHDTVIADLNGDGSLDIFSPAQFEFFSRAIINQTLLRSGFD